jgi:hypothetical protein
MYPLVAPRFTRRRTKEANAISSGAIAAAIGEEYARLPLISEKNRFTERITP